MTAREMARRVVVSTMLAVLAWLTLNPLVTALVPGMSPALQSLMIGHQQLGIVFLLSVVFYFPLHILLARGFNRAALVSVLQPFKAMAFLVVTYQVADLVMPLSRWAVIPVYAAALAAYEWRRPRRMLLRGFDLALTVFLASASVTGPDDQLIRFLVPAIGVLVVYEGLKIGVGAAVRRSIDAAALGSLGLWTGLAMLPFAAMMADGTNAGRYGNFPEVDLFHYGTAFAFVFAVGGHAFLMGRRYAASGRSLVSVPVVVVVLALCGALEARNLLHYPAFAPEVVDTAGMLPTTVSPYTNVQGYPLKGKDAWFADRADTCATPRCHPELSAQHRLSAHGRAFTNDVFQWQLEDFTARMGREAADYCIACHAPLGVIQYPGDGSRGVVVDPATTTERGFTLGVDCVVCHRAVAERDPAKIGGASLTIRPTWLERERYLGEDDTPQVTDTAIVFGAFGEFLKDVLPIDPDAPDTPPNQVLHNFFIRAATPLHRRTYHVDRADWDAICGGCHVVRLPPILSPDGKERTVADHYLSSLDSPFHKAGVGCSGCHQQRMETYEIGFNTVSHSYLGSGSSLPYGDPADDRTFRTISDAYLAGIGDARLEAITRADLPPCIDDLSDPATGSMLLRERGETNPFDGTNGGLKRRNLLSVDLDVRQQGPGFVRLAVTTTNVCVGHAFPSGGGIKGYLEVVAVNRNREVVGRYGGVDDDGLPILLPTVLGARVADAAGNVIADRWFRDATRVVYSRSLAPGVPQTDIVDVSFPVDSAPTRVFARWYFLRPEFYRNRERGIATPVPAVLVGEAGRALRPAP